MADNNAQDTWKQDPDVVTPVQLARELGGIRPQIIFGWIRRQLIPVHRCACGHNYLLRSEIGPFLEKRDKEEEEKKARIEAELRGEATEGEPAEVPA